MSTVILGEKRDKSIQRRHPWIFSGAIAKIHGTPTPGETVEIRLLDNTLIGRGAFSPQSKIRVRVWSFSPDETIDSAFFQKRLERALSNRASISQSGDTAYRIVNAESDGLPGVIVDRYGDFLVGQFLTTGAQYWKNDIVSTLEKLIPNRGIFERSDSEALSKEGISPRTGALSGYPPPDLLEIKENNAVYLVDIRRGHKTGFYLDQRENRAAVASYAADSKILNCFSYTGAFAVAALKAGAHSVVNIDASADALAIAARHAEINGIDRHNCVEVVGDVFSLMRRYLADHHRFDMVILDPPKFAESRQHIDKAARGYKDINLLAFKLLSPGGILATFSCSGLVSADLFEKTVAWAAMDAGKDAQILKRLHQPPDHPVALSFPEGNYLKGLICRVL
jgi:23S rRNA (cytosine1962-C5)-methyltransferase